MTSYFFDLPKGKDLYGFMHWKSVKISCIRCMSSMKDIEGLVQRTKWTIDMNKGVRLDVEKLNQAPGGCIHAEMSGFAEGTEDPVHL